MRLAKGWIAAVAVVLWAVAGDIGEAVAQDRFCADPGESCGGKLTPECLRSFGAGSLPSAGEDCGARLDAYSQCLARYAEECGAVGGGISTPAVNTGRPSIETVWNAIKDSDNPELFEIFAEDFKDAPAGRTLVAAARDKARRLRQAASQARAGRAQSAPSGGFEFEVYNLNPEGDNYLALKAGPGVGYRKLRELGPGTRLRLLGVDGDWLNVALQDGAVGWAHGNWIRRVASSGGAGALDCDALWMARNAIWDRYGYCFTSDRGARVFDNSNCSRDLTQALAAMAPSDQAEVERLKAAENAQGCQ